MHGDIHLLGKNCNFAPINDKVCMNIIEIISNVRLRIDFFSVPGTCREIVDAIFSMDNGDVPERRLMTPYDQELIDLDSISTVLDVTLEEVMQRPVSIFTKKTVGGFPARFYVAENFFFVNVSISENLDDFADICKDLSNTLQTISGKVENALSVRRMTATVFAPCIIDASDMDERIQMTYFPMVKDNGINARYAETYEDGEFRSTVIRDISLGEINLEGENRMAYRLEFVGHCYREDLPEDKEKALTAMYDKAVERTNKYFK